MLSERVRTLLETQASLAASQKQAAQKAPDCHCGHPKENHLYGEGHCTCRTDGSHYCQCSGYNTSPIRLLGWPCCTSEDIRDTRDPNSEMMWKFTMNELKRLRAERAKQNGK